MKDRTRITQAKVIALHRYYRITKFYVFLKDTAYKGLITILIFVALLVGLEYFFIDINALLNSLVESYSPQIILAFFLFSETVLGLLPPEIFIAWSAKSATPWLLISQVAVILKWFLRIRKTQQ